MLQIILALILVASINEGAFKSHPLVAAAAEGDTKAVEGFLKTYEIDDEDGRGNTALRAAVEHGHTNLARYLIEHGANLEHKNDAGTSVIFGAADENNAEMIRLLVKSGAKINAQSLGTHWTPLFMAVNNGRFVAAKTLLELGADPNLKTAEGNSPAAMATSIGDKKMIKLLKKYGAVQ